MLPSLTQPVPGMYRSIVACGGLVPQLLLNSPPATNKLPSCSVVPVAQTRGADIEPADANLPLVGSNRIAELRALLKSPAPPARSSRPSGSSPATCCDLVGIVSATRVNESEF